MDLVTQSGASPSPGALDHAAVDALLDRAIDAHECGQLEQAERGYEEVLRHRPDEFDALHLLGVIALQHGRVDRGVALIQKALEVDDGMAEAHANLGMGWMEMQRPDLAQDCFERACRLETGVAEHHFRRGVALGALQRWQDAAACLQRALDLREAHAPTHLALGDAQRALGHIDSARHHYARSSALQPDGPARIKLASVCLEAGRPAEALAHCDAMLAREPSHARALSMRADALQALGRSDEALSAYDRALAAQADDAATWTHRGNTLLKLGRTHDALASYRRAEELAPDNASVLGNLGGALREADRLDEAAACCQRAVSADPRHADAQMNLGSVLLDTGRLEEARAAFGRVVDLVPDHADAHWGMSMCDLLRGDFERGLPAFEWRWKQASFTSWRRHFDQPLWLGGEPVRGRTVLLHAEQGLGDTLQFCRYASMVADLGARVILQVQPTLLPLLRDLPGVSLCLSLTQSPPPFDLHCPLLSLPLALATRLESIPAALRYLAADPRRCEQWARRLGPGAGPRIGLVWSGNPAHRNDRHRSLALEDLLSAIPEGVALYSLQKDLRADDRRALERTGRVTHFGDELEDFGDTAALAEQMNLVISVDTSVAHLSAAMGKPTWVLLPWLPDWRWLLGRDDSPWYASVRLFRQSRRGDWTTALARLEQALHDEGLAEKTSGDTDSSMSPGG